MGTIDLDPPGDEWKETERAHDLIINRNEPFDTMVQNLGNPNLQEIELGTVWNEWQDMWTGALAVETGNRNVSRVREQTFRFGVPRRVLERTQIETTQEVNQTRTGIRSV